MRILLAEDNRDLSEWVSRLLRQSNYVVDCVHRGDEADTALQSQDYALLILDLGLPDLDGIEVLRRLRARGDATPVLILTANDAVSSRVRGLDSGADDYLVKPFEVEELEARIRAQLRRGRGRIEQILAYGALAFDSQSRSFALNGENLAFTPREHAVLETLILNAGRPVPKERLVENVFGFDDEAGPSAVEVYVHRVRKKLEGSDVGIITLRGLGYMLRRADVA
ncbi:DNA-binding response regulator [Labrys miyagiensis]|uniref:DNA-binding response regulator n=1 Tax=Labrys miyagiensis TaxID=346912 RepID=A0ABQ6C9T1_9HYPH|nr:response regulator [Labrys miyagiensis]GLS17133.1 DNA-binding response regulator [Labrys miyagiensis]